MMFHSECLLGTGMGQEKKMEHDNFSSPFILRYFIWNEKTMTEKMREIKGSVIIMYCERETEFFIPSCMLY